MSEVTEFLKQHRACSAGKTFAEQFETLADLYDGIERGDWIIWMLGKAGKIDKPVAVTLACEFALRALPKYEAKYNRKEPRLAIEAALAWLENQTEDNTRMAYAAADAVSATKEATTAAVYTTDAAYAAADTAYAASTPYVENAAADTAHV